ncbi:MAG: hypothetical protein RMJ33_09580 [Saprospiraceae bacterium]|nr:hypothetical protein [Saprospiraceae bacterium]MDW8230075.1 hypothetical protein [Saprospiraceae bacterium]
MDDLSWRERLVAMAAVIVLFGLIWLYTREYPVFTNTLQASRLVLGAFLFGLLLAGALLYFLRKRLTPWANHLPEVLLIVFFIPLFMPLFASRLNRAGGSVEHRPFKFVAEAPYVASAYGWLRYQPIEVTGYRLIVKDGEHLRQFQYKSQPYFPITQPGDTVLLPVRCGLLGVEVMELK